MISPLSRSLTSAPPSGRNASPHGTWRPVITVRGLLRSGAPRWGVNDPSVRGSGGTVEAEGAAAAEVASTCGAEPLVQAERNAAPAAIATIRVRGAVVIGIHCHAPAKFTRFPA